MSLTVLCGHWAAPDENKDNDTMLGTNRIEKIAFSAINGVEIFGF